MRIQHWQKAHDFYLRHPRSKESLLRWKHIVSKVEWKNFADVKKTFEHRADIFEDDWWIFDISNNNYRLIAIVVFDDQQVWIKQILTHLEYSTNEWKKKKEYSRATKKKAFRIGKRASSKEN